MKTGAKTPRKKRPTATLRDGRFAMVIKPDGNVEAGATVRFGGVTVVTPKSADEDIRKQIKEGRRVALKLTKALAKPGVTLRKTPGTPLFRADPSDTTLVIQDLDGTSTRGRFIDGRFVQVPSR